MTAVLEWLDDAEDNETPLVTEGDGDVAAVAAVTVVVWSSTGRVADEIDETVVVLVALEELEEVVFEEVEV